MNPRRALAMLSTKTANLAGSSGGIPETTQADVAAALTAVKCRFQLAAILLRWAGQGSEEHVTDLLLSRAAKLKVDNGWRRGKVKLRRLCEIAVDEWLRPSQCRACGAEGNVAAVKCASCDGTGIRRKSGRAYAVAVGIDESSWRQSWASRYAEIVAVLEQAESEGLRALGKALMRSHD